MKIFFRSLSVRLEARLTLEWCMDIFALWPPRGKYTLLVLRTRFIV